MIGFVVTWFKYIRAVSMGSRESFISLRIAAIAAGVAPFLARRRLLAGMAALVASSLLTVATLYRFARRPVSRNEGIDTKDETAELDFSFRNPRWGRLATSAVQPETGYDPRLAVDGTAELLAALETDGRAAAEVSGDSVQLDVWLIPFAAYHIDELGPVIAELRTNGIQAGIVFVREPSAPQLASAGAYTREVYLAELCITKPPLVALGMMDWGPVGELLARLRKLGTRLVAKVEGAQDFRNVDTPRRILPYSTADLVLAQGRFDAESVCATNVDVVGSARVERLLGLVESGQVEAIASGPLINLNFSYGTYEVWSSRWYAEATRATSGYGSSTSVHPAVRADYAHNRTSWPLALAIETSQLLITRCSTAVFDALAVGRPVVYFNPHGERVWKHVPWSDLVPEVRDGRQLARRVEDVCSGAVVASTESLQQWLSDAFISVSAEESAVERTANALIRTL